MDLRKSLSGKERTIRIVEAPAEADIVVRIDSRNTRKENAGTTTYAQRLKNGKAAMVTTTPTVHIVNVLHATILAGDSQIPLETEAITWRAAAGAMASSVDHWTKENYAKLVERRVRGTHGGRNTEEAAGPRPDRLPNQKSSADTSIVPGMAEAQVLEAMGAPDKKLVFGKKSLWHYDSVQVVFEEGKVTDVKF